MNIGLLIFFLRELEKKHAEKLTAIVVFLIFVPQIEPRIVS